jgi:hypothetical protein
MKRSPCPSTRLVPDREQYAVLTGQLAVVGTGVLTSPISVNPKSA